MEGSLEEIRKLIWLQGAEPAGISEARWVTETGELPVQLEIEAHVLAVYQ